MSTGKVISDVIRGYFFFQAEDGIRDLVRSRGLGDVYKRQIPSGVNGKYWPRMLTSKTESSVESRFIRRNPRPFF